MTAIGATAVGVTAVRNYLKLWTIINIGSTIIHWWSLFCSLQRPLWIVLLNSVKYGSVRLEQENYSQMEQRNFGKWDCALYRRDYMLMQIRSKRLSLVNYCEVYVWAMGEGGICYILLCINRTKLFSRDSIFECY